MACYLGISYIVYDNRQWRCNFFVGTVLHTENITILLFYTKYLIK